VGALCITFILKLNPLFIYIYVHVYVCSKTILSPVNLAGSREGKQTIFKAWPHCESFCGRTKHGRSSCESLPSSLLRMI